MICEHMPPLYTTTELNDNVVENLDEVLSIKSPVKVVIRNAGGQNYVLSGMKDSKLSRTYHQRQSQRKRK